MRPTVSIATASRNYARFLPQTIESVLVQTFRDWEMLIVDDGSTDDTAAVVKPYLRDPRLRYLRADRLGLARAKSLAVDLTRGPFVAFLDADDVWRPTKLEKQLARFEQRPEVGVVFCLRSLMDGNGALLPPRPAPPPPRGRVLAEVFRANFLCYSACMARREALARVGRFDPACDLAVDFDLWLRVASRYAFDCIDEDLVLYRTGHANLSKKLADRVDIALSLMERAEARFGAAEQVTENVRADGYSSTYRTIAYVMRESEPATAARWYLRALRYPRARTAALKGLAAAGLSWLRGRRPAAVGENASFNR